MSKKLKAKAFGKKAELFFYRDEIAKLFLHSGVRGDTRAWLVTMQNYSEDRVAREVRFTLTGYPSNTITYEVLSELSGIVGTTKIRFEGYESQGDGGGEFGCTEYGCNIVCNEVAFPL